MQKYFVEARQLLALAIPVILAQVAQTAAAWPDLYALNRDVIGPDPDVIEPGQRLLLPPIMAPERGTE